MNSRKKLLMGTVCTMMVLSFVFSEVSGQAIVAIYSNVTGFEVWWDGRHIFTAPSDKDYCWFYNVALGRHTITLRKSGCSDATRTVDITAAATYEITINMNCGPDPSGSPDPSGHKDSDRDGVTDDKDQCYNANCNIVDSRGCPKDYDSDGVNDCEDDCPYEKGAASNDGCPEDPVDKDNDGVTDDRDSCYNPGCRTVDSQGCPKDYDSDGVNDCEDDCKYDKGPASNHGCPEDYSTNIFKYWWIIAVLICALGAVLYLNHKRPPKLKM